MPKLPPQLLNSLSKLENFDVKSFETVHASDDKPTSIRFNPFKRAVLDFDTGEKVAWSGSGFYLRHRPYFTHDPLFHAGCYYVQEAGSMFLEQALTQTFDLSKNLKVLDLCAAPGGKSTLINSLISSESMLVANETVKSRAAVLAQNLGRWGTCNCVVTNNFPERFTGIGPFFDAIVVDAPCSGSGLFRKQPEAIGEWSPEAVKVCAIRQHAILSEILPTLKEDGILVYSTCSYSEEENEQVVQWLVAEHGMRYLALQIEKEWCVNETGYGYRFYPHLTKSEGFFCAVLQKQQGDSRQLRPLKAFGSINKAESEICRDFLKPGCGILHKVNGRIHLLNEAVLDFINRFEKNFYYKKAGTLVGEIKGAKLVPEQELAWSVNTGNGFGKLELGREEALSYLRKETFLKGVHEQNLVLVTYKGLGLGWAKILGNRVNNYLPTELRVLS